MGKASIKSENGVTSISCVRGPLSTKRSIVKDRLGNEWHCKLTKEEFKKKAENFHLEVFNDKGLFEKKFIKSYLTLVRDLEITGSNKETEKSSKKISEDVLEDIPMSLDDTPSSIDGVDFDNPPPIEED